MCLENIITKYPKIAKEDIVCYKVVRRLDKRYHGFRFITPYMKARIKLGYSYTSELDNPEYGWNVVNEGLHAFLTLEQAELCKLISTEWCIVKCIVPKGAKYYIGTFYGRFGQTAIAATEIKYGNKLLKFKPCAQ